jgi:16S rRNA (adenine1518-N6/adenine1519-N6)-dimethyltransferase
MDVRELLDRYDIRPSKGLGQSFLVAAWAYERILEAAQLSAHDVVLEIGPGLGTLTRRLAEAARHVIAVELDERMVTILKDTLAGRDNVTVHQADILETDPAALLEPWMAQADADAAYKVVANLPYYITSRALRHLLTAPIRPERLVLMVQLEVADRIVATPGDMSLLAVSVQVFGAPERVCRVPADAFYPRPNVDSAVLAVDIYPEPMVPESLLPRFFQVVRAGFQQRRKQIHNSLVANLSLDRQSVADALEQAGIASQRRPQTLAIEEWVRLTQALYPADDPSRQSSER